MYFSANVPSFRALITLGISLRYFLLLLLLITAKNSPPSARLRVPSFFRPRSISLPDWWLPPSSSSTVPSPYSSVLPTICCALIFDTANEPHITARAGIAHGKPNCDQIKDDAVTMLDTCCKACIAICCFCAFACSCRAFCSFFFARSSSFCAICTLFAYPLARASISASSTSCALSTSRVASSAFLSAAFT